jgi:hypothetical protein
LIRGVATTAIGVSTAGIAAQAEGFELQRLWDLGLQERGLAIEEALGGNLPPGFPTIDRFSEDVATSIKSMDLTSPSYQDPARVMQQATEYINKLYNFEGNITRAGVTVGEPVAKVLQWVVPEGVANPEQQGALDYAVDYGARNGITVEILQFK